MICNMSNLIWLRKSIYEHKLLQKDVNFWRSYNKGQRIRFYNFWKSQDIHDMWLYRFVNAHIDMAPEKEIVFVSTLGSKDTFSRERSCNLVFFTGENLHDRFLPFSDNMMNDPRIGLSIGFDSFDNDKYIRFPLWILYNFEPDASDEQISERIKRLRYPDIQGKNRFCSMVASHDQREIRARITQQVSKIGHVCCPGNFYHNDDSLKNDFSDDIIEYLKHFKFNICPENSNSFGYVTEKIFHAIDAGCVPIYWGSNNIPEPGVINHDAVLFFQPGEDNYEMLFQINAMNLSINEWQKFASQPRLLPGAEEYVIDKYHELQAKLERIFQ